MRGGWGCAWNSPCAWLLLAPPPEAPLRATVIRLSGLDRGARFAGAGWEAGLARRVRTDSAPPHFVTQAPWGRPPSARTDRCPCRCPDRPLSLPLSLLLATGPAFSCHSSWSSGQELRFVLLRAWSRPKPWGRGNRHPVGLRGWDPGFRLPGVWGTLTLEREPSKRQLRMHSGCGPRTRGRFAAGLPGPPFPLRAEAPWTRSAAPCCAGGLFRTSSALPCSRGPSGGARPAARSSPAPEDGSE